MKLYYKDNFYAQHSDLDKHRKSLLSAYNSSPSLFIDHGAVDYFAEQTEVCQYPDLLLFVLYSVKQLSNVLKSNPQETGNFLKYLESLTVPISMLAFRNLFPKYDVLFQQNIGSQYCTTEELIGAITISMAQFKPGSSENIGIVEIDNCIDQDGAGFEAILQIDHGRKISFRVSPHGFGPLGPHYDIQKCAFYSITLMAVFLTRQNALTFGDIAKVTMGQQKPYIGMLTKCIKIICEYARYDRISLSNWFETAMSIYDDVIVNPTHITVTQNDSLESQIDTDQILADLELALSDSDLGDTLCRNVINIGNTSNNSPARLLESETETKSRTVDTSLNDGRNDNQEGQILDPGTVEEMQIRIEESEQEHRDAVLFADSKYYERKWQLINGIEVGKSWNWCAFFIPLLWLMYRKLHGHAFALFIMVIIIQIISTFISIIFGSSAGSAVFLLMNICVMIVCGLFANQWYYRLARRTASSIRADLINESEDRIIISIFRAGGTSIASVFLGVFLYIVLNGVVARLL